MDQEQSIYNKKKFDLVQEIKAKGGIKGDFQNIDLSGANLSKTFLHNADFSNATLIHTNLSGADLKHVKFQQLQFLRLPSIVQQSLSFLQEPARNLHQIQRGGIWLQSQA